MKALYNVYVTMFNRQQYSQMVSYEILWHKHACWHINIHRGLCQWTWI